MKTRFMAIVLSMTMLVGACAIGTGSAFAAGSSSYTVSYGTTDGKTLSTLTALTADQTTVYSGNGSFTLNSSTGIPCQVFEVDTSAVTTDTLTLSVGASTTENERVALKVLNVATGAWDTVNTAVTTGTLSAEVALADYAKDGKLQAMVTLDFVANGSNRFLWSTDQQHYTKHDDLNEFYYQIHEYMVEEYQNDNVAYVINTGDIVDDTPLMSTAAKQWQVADNAFKILDDAGVPYGIETGNHDVGDNPCPDNNYTHYLRYFSAERYENAPWYGGTIDDNKCHYDLVTVGNYDFLFLYIGYGQGKSSAVLDWANSVLAMYPHRNAILCTHQYLKPTTLTQEGRAEILHSTVVSQNPNVKMVLSGHYDGAGYIWRDADGRDVLEVCADYQFVQAESEEYYAEHKDPLHKIGSVEHCNGEGYIREIFINGNTIDMYAFSPVTGGKTPFGVRDDLRFNVELQAAQRTLTTFGFTVADKAATPTQDTTKTVTVVCDAPAMQTLITKAEAIDQTPYTKDSVKAMTDALATAKTVVSGSGSMSDAYVKLSTALGALEEDTFVMDPAKLEVVHKLDLQLHTDDKTGKTHTWENYDGVKSLSKITSNILTEQLESGGFIAKKNPTCPTGWPAMKYKQAITFTPKDGKVYLYLDVVAGSMWSLFPNIIQDMELYEGRLNYALEGSYKPELDAGTGTYKGVYDITDALVAMGLDMNKEMTLTFVMNVVPGPITVNDITILTGAYPEETITNTTTTAPQGGNDTSDTPKKENPVWLWGVAIVAIVLSIAAIVFALTYQPKKKTTPPPSSEETEDMPEDENETDADAIAEEEPANEE